MGLKRQVISPDILVIEDDIETIEGILSELELVGYSFEHVRDLTKAAKKLRNQKYKLILVDLRMPSRNDQKIVEDGGLRLLKRLRLGDFGNLNQDIPYALLSAQDFRIERLEAKIEDPLVLSRLRKGRVAKFQKGDSMMPLVQQIKNAIPLT